jgi:GNAT superfamily N-acetyltransferase
MLVITPCSDRDVEAIWEIVNDAASAYRGVIPADCWHEPYMPRDELDREIASGVRFWGFSRVGVLLGVMGLQEVRDVTLIRHAYVRPDSQRQGVGGALLTALRAQAASPMLVGTWADAGWAIAFYQRHGFRLLPALDTQRLLGVYWRVPARQAAVSVVLAGPDWVGAAGPPEL